MGDLPCLTDRECGSVGVMAVCQCCGGGRVLPNVVCVRAAVEVGGGWESPGGPHGPTVLRASQADPCASAAEERRPLCTSFRLRGGPHLTQNRACTSVAAYPVLIV